MSFFSSYSRDYRRCHHFLLAAHGAALLAVALLLSFAPATAAENDRGGVGVGGGE